MPTSRTSAAPVLPNVDRHQRAEPGDRARVRETDTTAKTIQAIAEGTQRREAPKVDPQAVISALATPVAVVGADWRIVMVNSAWERVFGFRSSDCVRRDLFACFPFLADDFAASMLRAALEDRATRSFELELARESGVGHRYEIRASCGDDALLIVEALQPRTFAAATSESHDWPDERDEENASLRSLARQMTAVVDSAELLELLCDAASHQCHGTGAAVLRLTGHDGEVVAAAGPMSVALGRHFPLRDSVASEVVRSRGVVAVENFSASMRPLARVVSELRIGPLLAAPLIAHDVTLGVLAVVRGPHAVGFSGRDTQRLRVIADHAALAMWKAQLLEQSQAADRAKGRFLATVSHELRTPLTALTGYEELLADEVIGPLTEAQTDVLERMRSVTHHLTVMIEEVLAYSSIEAGHEVLRPSEFLAGDLVRAALAIVDPLARQKKLRLVCDVPDEPIRLTSDIDKVRQIIVNLAGNAVKFTDQGEVRIILSVQPVGSDSSGARHEVRFTVRDTGIGIAPEDLRRLFQPFAQVDTGLTRRHGGTGLGLYISQRLAQLLGGRLDVESERGTGSSFTLVLDA